MRRTATFIHGVKSARVVKHNAKNANSVTLDVEVKGGVFSFTFFDSEEVRLKLVEAFGDEFTNDRAGRA